MTRVAANLILTAGMHRLEHFNTQLENCRYAKQIRIDCC